MDWSLILAELLNAVPALAGALVGGTIAVAGGVMAQYLTHRFTHQRDGEKLLREKAEELIYTLCQIDHSVFIWHEGLERDARVPRPTEREAIGNRSLEPRGASVSTSGMRRLPEPGEYQTLIHSIDFDAQRADILQRLYFPVV